MLQVFAALLAGLIAILDGALPSPLVVAPVHEISIEAKKFAYEPAVVQVIAGEPVRLLIHSSDTTHGFSIKEVRIKMDVPRSGETVVAAFTAPPPGRYEIACSEICGRGHRQMKAALVSVAPAPAPPIR